MKVEFGPSLCRIWPSDRDETDWFCELFSKKDPNPERSKEYNEGTWDGIHRFYFDDNGDLSLPTGFYKELEAAAKKEGFTLTKRLAPSYNGEAPPKPHAYGINMLDGITLREYQMDSLQTTKKKYRGVIRIPPRGGKTEVQAAIVLACDQPSLVLVHTTRLLRQTYKRFKKRGLTDIGRIGDDYYEIDAKHIIAMAQSLWSGIKRQDQKVVDMLHNREVLIADEVHHYGSAKTWNKVALECMAPRRYGFSGTPLHESGKRFNASDRWMKGVFGPIIYNIEAKELQKLGFLAVPDVHFIEVSSPRLWHTNNWHTLNRNGLVGNLERNLSARNVAHNLAHDNYKVLILVKEIKHGRWFCDALHTLGVASAFVYGGGKVEVPLGGGRVGMPEWSHARTLRRFKKGKIEVLVGSTVFDEGVDIPFLDALIICSGGKAQVATTQRAYRSLTSKKGKRRPKVFDFDDLTSYVLKHHSQQRRETYAREGMKVSKCPPRYLRLEKKV